MDATWPMVAAVAVAACLTGCDRSNASSAIVLTDSEVVVFATSPSIATVTDLEVLPNGNVWVLNSVEPLFIGFDSAGTVSQEHGRVGGGPEEFGVPSAFVVGGIEGEPWIYDAQRHALLQVSNAGQGRPEVSLPQDAIPPGSVLGTNPTSQLVRIERLGDEVLLPRRQPGDLDVASFWRSVWAADIVALTVPDAATRELLSLSSVLEDPSDQFDLNASPLPFPLWYRLWTVCGPNEIRVYDRMNNQIRGFTAQGSEVNPAPLSAPEFTEVGAREFAMAIFDLAVIEGSGSVTETGISMTSADSAQVLNILVPRVDGGPERLAELLPRYVDLHCDDAGNQWIQLFDLESPGSLMSGLKGSRRWLRIVPNGSFREVRMPERFDPLRFTSNRIWGVLRDELDVASIAWIAAP